LVGPPAWPPLRHSRTFRAPPQPAGPSGAGLSCGNALRRVPTRRHLRRCPSRMPPAESRSARTTVARSGLRAGAMRTWWDAAIAVSGLRPAASCAWRRAHGLLWSQVEASGGPYGEDTDRRCRAGL